MGYAIANGYYFGVERSVITKHVANIFTDEELDELNNVQKMHIVGSKQPVNIYTLDVILSVGYRVNSKTANDYQVLYEYKQFLGGKADEHVRQAFNSYQSQLEAPKQKQIGK